VSVLANVPEALPWGGCGSDPALRRRRKQHLSSLRRLFRQDGYRVLIAPSGARVCAAEAEAVDLVISDMRMPEMDGARFLAQVRARWPHAVRILLTGYADIASTVAAINQGEIYRYIPSRGRQRCAPDRAPCARTQTAGAREGAPRGADATPERGTAGAQRQPRSQVEKRTPSSPCP